ncbi:hypothetical protein IW141_005705, partial [Coemansia sp. RSA 355]
YLQPYIESTKFKPSHQKRPGPVQHNGQDEYEVEQIVNHRDNRRHGWQYLVKWKGYSKDTAEWVHEDELRHAPQVLQEYLATLEDQG